PPELDQLGLSQALRWLAANAAEASAFRLESRIEDLDGHLAPELELHVYRVAQEALTNAMKHGDATEVTLEAERAPTLIALSVFDNGKGFDIRDASPGAPSPGTGLKTMNERAAMLGGDLEIRSEPGIGTRVTLRAPLPPSSRTANPTSAPTPTPAP
ncbi:MAG: sensor histidine kinase, partial [Limisphaerales bacterium]